MQAIKKQSYNPEQIIKDLKEQKSKSEEYQQLINQFDQIISKQVNQMNKMLSYGHYVYQINEKGYQTEQSTKIQEENQQLQKKQKKNEKIKDLETKLNLQQENYEKLAQTYKACQEENAQLQEQIQVLTDQNQKQIKRLLKKDDQISSYQSKMEKNEEALKKNAQSIIQLKEQNEKILVQIEEITTDRNNLLERLLQEKHAFVEKMNLINKMTEDIEAERKQLQEDMLYFQQQKDDFLSQSQKQGRRTSSVLSQQQTEEKKDTNQTQQQPFKMLKPLLKHHKYEIYQIAQTLNGQLMASCGGDNQIKIYDPLSLNTFNTISSSDPQQIFISLAFAPLTDLIAVSSSDKSVQLYNYSTGKLKVQLQGHCDRVNTVQFTSEKEKVASGGADRVLKIWDINKGSCVKTVSCGSIVRYVDYFQSEPHLLTGHNDGSVRLYSTGLNNNKPFYNIQGVFEGGLTCCRLSNCHNYIICSSADGFSVKLIDIRKQKVVKSYEHTQYFNNHEFNKCCFGQNDKFIMAGGSDGTIFVWDIASGSCKSIFKNSNHQGVIVALDYHNVTGNLYSGDSRGNLIIWNS